MAEDNQQNQQGPPPEVSVTPKLARIGLNLDSIISEVPQGQLTYALNAQLENFDGNQITYQNEQANELCISFPEGYKLIGRHNIVEQRRVVFFLCNPSTSGSEIGLGYHDTCTYQTLVNNPCLNFQMDDPIHKAVHKLTNCGTEVYWPSKRNPRRYIDIDNLPYAKDETTCPATVLPEIDCNRLNVQPNFDIPEITVEAVDSDGELLAGTYQFAVAYANALGETYTSYYSVTNPVPIFDINKITLDFNYPVSRSINVKISNIDTTGFYDYLNLAVVKNINNITSTELVGVFQIVGTDRNISYTGQNKQSIRLEIDDIFEKYPIYEGAEDLTVANDVLIWDQLRTEEQISYQRIANQITLGWQTWRIDGNSTYSNPINSVYLRGYMRDEVYPLEIVFLLGKGKQTDGFHIPGRTAIFSDVEPVSNYDTIHDTLTDCEPTTDALPRWKVYNTGCIEGFAKEYENFISGHPSDCFKCPPGEDINPNDPRCYVGPFQYGCMSYWESTETYPCNPEVYGELSGQPIRHHKLPDSLITHIHDNEGFIYPIGIRVDIQQILDLIRNSDLSEEQKAKIQGFKIVRGNRATNKSIKAKGLISNVGKYGRDEQFYYFPNYGYNDLRHDPFLSVSRTADDSGPNINNRLDAFSTDESKKRYVFHSPDTHFYQPTLGNILKLETAEFGKSKGHFVQVKKHARYKFLTTGAFSIAIGFAIGVGVAGFGTGDGFETTASVAAYQTFLDIVYRLLPRKNMTYQYTSIGNYTDFKAIANSGNKQRRTDIQFYLSPGMQGVGDSLTVNNYQRESSVYLRTLQNLPFPHEIVGVPEDKSKYLISDVDCDNPSTVTEQDISCYYASIKQIFDNQYGQLYSYETIDTGFQVVGISPYTVIEDSRRFQTVFGGDTFINRFAYKKKLPFFLDNRVNFPNDADIEFDEIPNVAWPIFWFSTGYQSDSADSNILGFYKELLGVQLNNFDCNKNTTFYQSGKIYLFHYGIPYFYCESEVNVDMRGAFNIQEGDFFPRVSSDIPDDWLQEVNTTIQQDNSYHYNRSYSKQNKENEFTHLPQDFTNKDCRRRLDYRAIMSDEQEDVINYDRNNWLLYRPTSYFDFPRNYGKLTSLEAIEDRQVLARFENKTLLYNTTLVSPTSSTDLLLGSSLFLKQVPPQDLAADNDLGYMGTQHKLFLKSENGHISLDAKRGQVFLVPRRMSAYYKPQIQDLSTGLSKFFTQNLDFQIVKTFPDVDIDNTFNGIGLTGVYDSKYNRLIVTKLDYEPVRTGITHLDGKFYYGTTEISLTDNTYFCNRSFTISYDFDSKDWVSFHSYLPNWYLGESNFFYAGLQTSMWRHNTSLEFNKFFGVDCGYSIEYPFAFQEGKDEILQALRDYSKVYEYVDERTAVEIDEWFTQLVLTTPQNCSGMLNLIKKPAHNMQEYMKYPIYRSDSKDVLFTKADSEYRVNTFWGLISDKKKPIWKKSCENTSVYKELNVDNLNYGKRSFNKEPLRGRDLKVRLMLKGVNNRKIVSTFFLAETQKSNK